MYMKLLRIEDVKTRMAFKSKEFIGYKATKDRNCVVLPGEGALIQIVYPPKDFSTPYKARKITTYVLRCNLLEKVNDEIFMDNESINLIITKKDYSYLAEVAKVKSGDTITLTSKMGRYKFSPKVCAMASWLTDKNKVDHNEVEYKEEATELVASGKKGEIRL